MKGNDLEGKKLVLHSINGNDYKISVYNYNEFREPSMEYAIFVSDMSGNSISTSSGDDIWFVGQEFIDKCELIEEDE